MKIIHFYNLKKGVDKEEYKKWAREVDLRTTYKAPGFKRTNIFEIGEVEGKESFKHEFIEIADVENVEAWKNLENVDFMKKVIKEWGDYCDEGSSLVFYTKEL